MDGVLGSRLASTISIILGRPSVTLMFATPAKWKVRRFIWVAGSPRECAAMTPADSFWSIRWEVYILLATEISFSQVSSSRSAFSILWAMSQTIFMGRSTPSFSSMA